MVFQGIVSLHLMRNTSNYGTAPLNTVRTKYTCIRCASKQGKYFLWAAFDFPGDLWFFKLIFASVLIFLSVFNDYRIFLKCRQHRFVYNNKKRFGMLVKRFQKRIFLQFQGQISQKLDLVKSESEWEHKWGYLSFIAPGLALGP